MRMSSKLNATSVLLMIGILVLTSCKDDPGPPAKISFFNTTTDAKEGDGTITVKVQTDRNASQDLTVTYTIDPSSTAKSGDDYNTLGTLVIPKGTQIGELSIDIVDDNVYDVHQTTQNGTNYWTDNPETIVITLSSVDGNGQLSEVIAGLTHTVTVEDNDPLPYLDVTMTWDSGDGTPGDVDMDLYVWSQNQIVDASETGAGGEEIFVYSIPEIYPDGNYGLSYRYYSGTSDNVTITVTFTVTGGTLLSGQTTATYTANLSLANINDGTPLPPSQTFSKSGKNYPTISAISIPSSGSRVGAYEGVITFPRGMMPHPMKRN